MAQEKPPTKTTEESISIKTTRTRKTIMDAPKMKAEAEKKFVVEGSNKNAKKEAPKKLAAENFVEKELQQAKDKASEQKQKQEEESVENLSGAFVNKKGPAKKAEEAKKDKKDPAKKSATKTPPKKQEVVDTRNEGDLVFAIDRKAEIYSKAREGLKYGSITEEEEKKAKEDFNSARIEYKNFLISRKEKELKDSGKSKEEIEIALESYKKGELFDRVFIQGEKRLQTLETSKETLETLEKKSWVEKGLNWYGRQNKLTKTVIAGSFITLGALSVEVVVPALATKYLATRIIRGLVGAKVGSLVVEASKKIMYDPDKNLEEKMEALRKKFANDSDVLEQINNQRNLFAIKHKTESRNRSLKLLGIGLVTGVGTSLSLSHFFGDQMDSMWAQAKDFDYQGNIEGVGTSIKETVLDWVEGEEDVEKVAEDIGKEIGPEEVEMIPPPTIPESTTIPENAYAKQGDGITQIMKRQLEGDKNLAEAYNYPPKTGSDEMYFLKLAQRLGYIDEAGNEVRIIGGENDKIAYKLSGSLENPTVEEYKNGDRVETHQDKTPFEGEKTEEYEKVWTKQAKTPNRFGFNGIRETPDETYSLREEALTEQVPQTPNRIIITEEFSKTPMWVVQDTTGNPPLDTGNANQDIETLKNIRGLAEIYPPTTDSDGLATETVEEYLSRVVEAKAQEIDGGVATEGLTEADTQEGTTEETKPKRTPRYNFDSEPEPESDNKEIAQKTETPKPQELPKEPVVESKNEVIPEKTPEKIEDNITPKEEPATSNLPEEQSKEIETETPPTKEATPTPDGLEMWVLEKRFFGNMKDIGIDPSGEFWLSIREEKALELLNVDDVQSLTKEQDVIRSYVLYLEKALSKIDGVRPEDVEPKQGETVGQYIESALHTITKTEIAETVNENLKDDMKNYFKPAFFWSKSGIDTNEWKIVSSKTVFEMMKGEFGTDWQMQGDNKAFIGYLINLSKETKIPLPTKEDGVSVENWIKKALDTQARNDYSPKVLKVK